MGGCEFDWGGRLEIVMTDGGPAGNTPGKHWVAPNGITACAMPGGGGGRCGGMWELPVTHS